MPQSTVLEQAGQDGGETLICAAVGVQDQFFKEGFLGTLGVEEVLHGLAIAFVEVVADQAERVGSDFAENREGHHFLGVAVLHIVDVRILSCIVRDRVFGKLVEDLLVDVL